MVINDHVFIGNMANRICIAEDVLTGKVDRNALKNMRWLSPGMNLTVVAADGLT